MKKKFGLEWVMLICIFMFVGSNCLAEPPAPGQYTVTKAGGHMEVDDLFEIDTSWTLVPGMDFNGKHVNQRWNAKNDEGRPFPDKKYDLSVVGKGEDQDLCGFIEVKTGEHMDYQFGHNEFHGILIKKSKGNKQKDEKKHIKILWSALPLVNMPTTPEEKEGKCREIDILNHGGIAHARQ